MGQKEIDFTNHPRKEQFRLFSSYAYPYMGTTVPMDITDFASIRKTRKIPFFLSVLYFAAKAANQIPEFRQRIEGDKVIEYDHCPTSHTLLLPDENYCYCRLRCDCSYFEFLETGLKRQQEELRNPSVALDNTVSSFLYVSCTPSIPFTSVVLPTPIPADSNPRIVFGKTYTQEGRTLLPVAVLANHALVDGIHLSKFYQQFDTIYHSVMNEIEKNPNLPLSFSPRP